MLADREMKRRLHERDLEEARPLAEKAGMPVEQFVKMRRTERIDNYESGLQKYERLQAEKEKEAAAGGAGGEGKMSAVASAEGSATSAGSAASAESSAASVEAKPAQQRWGYNRMMNFMKGA